ncbi:hypothetical protein ACJ73_07376 [Blastomyces percursus]|uniref:Uncharacterized protein n=1 Tax=Blastomyces percursus TaxID=1658174 RepID=A0A1J9R143_9EURO|nr:hypothetical protein ACJ73_07376 [Blastomyces percursus]
MVNPEHPGHDIIHWAFCTEDDCSIHREGKDNNDYFPRRRRQYLRATIPIYDSDNNEPITESSDEYEDPDDLMSDNKRQEVIQELRKQIDKLTTRVRKYEEHDYDELREVKPQTDSPICPDVTWLWCWRNDCPIHDAEKLKNNY